MKSRIFKITWGKGYKNYLNADNIRHALKKSFPVSSREIKVKEITDKEVGKNEE